MSEHQHVGDIGAELLALARREGCTCEPTIVYRPVGLFARSRPVPMLEHADDCPQRRDDE